MRFLRALCLMRHADSGEHSEDSLVAVGSDGPNGTCAMRADLLPHRAVEAAERVAGLLADNGFRQALLIGYGPAGRGEPVLMTSWAGGMAGPMTGRRFGASPSVTPGGGAGPGSGPGGPGIGSGGGRGGAGWRGDWGGPPPACSPTRPSCPGTAASPTSPSTGRM